MRRCELAVIILLILTSLCTAGLWLKTQWSHHRAAVLMDHLLTKKPLNPETLTNVLEDFPDPYQELLPGKHLFYESILAVAAAEKKDIPESRRLQWIYHARDALEDALTREPARSNAWTYLAYSDWLLDGPCQKSVKALRMAIYTSPADKQMLLWRLKLAGLNRDFWDPGFNDLIIRQIILAWRYAPKALARMAEESRLEDLIRETLSSDPADLNRFNDLLRRHS